MATSQSLLKQSKPLSAFVRLSPVVSLYEPPPIAGADHVTSGSTGPPTTILLCSWMNARPKNVAYYVGYHMTLYPQARIILVTMSTAQFLFQSETRRRQDVQAAVEAILTRDQKHDRILVHSFSNGGGKRLYGVSAVYRKLTGKPFSPIAIVFDSSPGIPSFQRDLHSLMIAGRKLNWFLWLPFAATTLVLVSLVNICVHWMPRWFWRDLVWGPLEGINETKLLSEKSVRGYIYSAIDQAIDWKDVENHASTAEQRGFTIVKEKIEDAEHVQLFKGTGGDKRYWGFVQKVWEYGQGSVR